jgi:hypothetical protein
MRGLACLGGAAGRSLWVAGDLVSIRPDRGFASLVRIPDLIDGVVQVVLGIRDHRAFIVPSVSVGDRAFTNPLRATRIPLYSRLPLSRTPNSLAGRVVGTRRRGSLSVAIANLPAAYSVSRIKPAVGIPFGSDVRTPVERPDSKSRIDKNISDVRSAGI